MVTLHIKSLLHTFRVRKRWRINKDKIVLALGIREPL
ncbi:Uncharacterised protein [Vibrio cholerae]|nr:Uncharacterised protein [Vibrio cholerae]